MNPGRERCWNCDGLGSFTCSVCGGTGSREVYVYEPTPIHFPDFPSSPSFSTVASPYSADRGEQSAGTPRSSVSDTAILLLLGTAVITAAVYGIAQMLVAAEVFFAFAGFTAMRLGRAFGGPESGRLESARQWCALLGGLAAGGLAAWIMLETPQGHELNAFIIAQQTRILGSIVIAAMAPSLLNWLLDAVVGSLRP